MTRIPEGQQHLCLTESEMEGSLSANSESWTPEAL